VLDVHARGVDLVVEGEAAREGDAALVLVDDAPGGADQHLLAVLVVQKHHAVEAA
jgi:hypothetical protein